ncbi:uncharacterized protein RCC_08563 [Ramularia collo-cygni]|uniref:Aminoglycoside phosphotransferase domain-containing protein n=1 Tax=Ramularia collo-cygni TaxID=112498 RepID=A0A2D3UXT4_9PEZI|nr:uncharacterized protein RCC_08563 [Ramularia collo-cygni]CZT22857.1 uncharacterized protein RCC_08563 [Ramularia collo-cygni]
MSSAVHMKAAACSLTASGLDFKDLYKLAHTELARSKVISRCRSGDGTWIHRNQYGPQVIRFSGIAVKFGFGVDMQQAETQAYHYRHADNSCLVIPQVLDYFMVPGTEGIFETGFLVMEYVCGRTVQDLPKDDKQRIAPRVANAMKYLETIKPPDLSRPGPPIKDGVPCGYLWSDTGPGRSFNTFNEMNTWLDQ